MKAQVAEEVLRVLAAAPEGLSAPELRRRLGQKLSQPTLWRLLNSLRARGVLTMEGKARGTRYHAAVRTAPSALRGRRLHESVARRLVAAPDLRMQARARLDQLRRVNPQGRVYHDRWEQLLDGPLPRLLRAMTEDSEAADDLRKESPLTTLVRPADRRRAFESVRPV